MFWQAHPHNNRPYHTTRQQTSCDRPCHTTRQQTSRNSCARPCAVGTFNGCAFCCRSNSDIRRRGCRRLGSGCPHTHTPKTRCLPVSIPRPSDTPKGRRCLPATSGESRHLTIHVIARQHVTSPQTCHCKLTTCHHTPIKRPPLHPCYVAVITSFHDTRQITTNTSYSNKHDILVSGDLSSCTYKEFAAVTLVLVS